MRSTRSRFHSCVEYRLTVSVGLVAAVWVAAVSRWVVSDLVVPWDSKNQFYAFFRFLSATLRSGEQPFWNPFHYGGLPCLSHPPPVLSPPGFPFWGAVHSLPTIRPLPLRVLSPRLVAHPPPAPARRPLRRP